MEDNLNTKKLSYEQLENVAKELMNQVKMLETQVRNNQFNETVARLNYLFKVTEAAEGKFPKEYSDYAVKEIMTIMPMTENAIDESPTVIEMPTKKSKKQ